MRNKILALSAIGAAFVAIILTVGAYFEFADIFTIIISSVFVILPLYYKSYKGCFLSYFAGGVLAFLFSGFNILSVVFPSYFLFFGIYPIIKLLIKEKNFNKYIFAIFGIIWCVAVYYGMYYYYVFVMKIPFDDFPEKLMFIKENILYFIAILGVIFYFIYDRFIVVVKRVLDYYLGKVIKKD